MNKTKKKFFRLASLAAKSSTYPKLHIGAAIAYGSRLVSIGTNKMRTHTKQKKYTSYRYANNAIAMEGDSGRCHAEMDAIIKAGRNKIVGASIFVHRRDLNGDLANCRPCGACMQAIKEAKIKDVYYTSRDGYNHLEIVQ
jgi:deoxycytidylate deaminase